MASEVATNKTGAGTTGTGSGDNSDNSGSGLISIGNTSFGFNFDSEDGHGSPNNSNNSEEGDSDSQGNKQNKPSQEQSEQGEQAAATEPPAASPVQQENASHQDAAAAKVASLQSIAVASSNKCSENQQDLKRKAMNDTENDSGYKSDDEEGKDSNTDASKVDEPAEGATSEKGSTKGPRKKKKLDDMKREERNAREKERSFRISHQISELRNLLSSGGVIVPKGTKSSVLTEAANYIRMLQQHQYRSEIDRHQLVQQIQMIGGGALGQQAASAVRHVAAQNGVWSLGNFGGVPPKSAMMSAQPGATPIPGESGSDGSVQQPQQSPEGAILPNRIDDPDYRFVFNSCTVGMAIASMGGAFIDCNSMFCQLSNYTKQELCSMTIFNLTARQDLQHAFDLISQMLSAPPDQSTPSVSSSSSCHLRGSLNNRNDLGLSVTLIKGEDTVAKCFCVTLVVNPGSPFENAKPVPATVEHVQAMPVALAPKAPQATMEPTPAYTTG